MGGKDQWISTDDPEKYPANPTVISNSTGGDRAETHFADTFNQVSIVPGKSRIFRTVKSWPAQASGCTACSAAHVR
jgi:hypothetical protein